jgi:ATP-dependent DNA helicase RecG
MEPVSSLKGVGEKTEKLLKKLDIVTVEDLLTHFPKNYDVYEDIRPIALLEEGKTAAIEGVLMSDPVVSVKKKLTLLKVRLKDASGSIGLTWFNMPFLKKTLHLGTKYIIRGEVKRKNGVLVMDQPAILSKKEFYNRLLVLQPCYALTAGITNNGLTKLMKQALKETDLNGDPLPVSIRREEDLMEYKRALRAIHFPKDREEMLKARKRLVFDDFFYFTAAVQLLKKNENREENRHKILFPKECERFLSKLPFPLTGAQKRVLEEIQKDVGGAYAMNRLIQGDVGSGKTVLAEISLLACALNGYQGCLMAPTEVLAKQHYDSLSKDLAEYGIETVLLVGTMTAKEKREAYVKIKEHTADIIIGTHALIQEKVVYDKLGLVITDEQHRFGVRQREKLSQKGEFPHILVMSATPIPRTLAIIIYGDLDVSVVDELPASRLPIQNCVVDTNYRPAAYRFMEKQVSEGHQVYIICPMVEESEAVDAENVIDYTQQVMENMPPYVNVAYLHGKMKPKEKNEIMERFALGEIHILVSTTVVEVGVNVPNATVMMVENAERFGLAQLHQLRGRVGRGSAQSYCIFMTGMQGKEIRERLDILRKSNDGFVIANEDLKLRGPGDMFGIRQSGTMEFKIGDIYNDSTVLLQANEAAKRMFETYGETVFQKFPQLEDKISRYTGQISL